MSTRVIAVTGGKGGVGKSTTTINLGVSLRMDGYSVALVDADVEMPNLVEMLGMEPGRTLHDVLSGRATPREALQELGPRFAVMPGDPGLSGYASIEPERLDMVVTVLGDVFDYILLDTGAGLSYDDLFPLGLADEILLVTSPDPAAVENAKRTQAFVRRLGRQVRGVVVTKTDGPLDSSILEAFDAPLVGVIPDDPAVKRSTAVGKPLELSAPDSPAAEAYRRLEATMTDGVLPPRRSEPSPEPPEEPEAEDDAEDEEAEAPVATDGPDERRRGGLISRIVQFVT